MTGKSLAEQRAEYAAKRLAAQAETPQTSTRVDTPEPPSRDLDSMTLAELAHLRDQVEEAITRSVRQMRRKIPGEVWRQSTWADIGRHLKITRQAAQQRYGK